MKSMTPKKLDELISKLLEASCKQALLEYDTFTSPKTALEQVKVFLELVELRSTHDQINCIQRKWNVE